LFETAAVPVADEPPVAARADEVLPTAPDVLDGVPLADPVAEEDPVVEPPVVTAAPAAPVVVTAAPVVVTEFVCVAVVVGKLTAPEGFARFVPATPLVVAVVCAAAGATRIKENRIAV
jgi:hypothetical protein